MSQLTDSKMSVSEGFRDRGNGYYKSAMADGLSPVVVMSRLQNANNLYYRAIETSQSDEEKSSACKNYGMTSWKMAMMILSSDRDFKLICFHFKEAFKHFRYARENAVSCKPEDWLSSLEASCAQCWEDFHHCAFEMKMEQRLRVIDEMLPFLSTNLQICAFQDLANAEFHIGISALQNGDFKKCMYQMKECHYPIEKIKELRQFPGSHSGMESMEEDVVMHMSIAESAQSRQTGDELLKAVVQDEETLNIEMVWTVIDWYRQSIVLTRDLDMEMEAIALSRLGVVYDKVLKLKPKAKECFMNSVRLAESMHPRTFNTSDWYIESTNALKRYQEETVQQEEAEKTKERAEIKEKMKEQLDALDKQHMKMNNKDFLKHIYEKYKPKNPDHAFEEFDLKDDLQTKKRLQKAILHFHPDKVDVTKQGWEWKIMTEEITKYLTKRYEIIKVVL